jgi:molecular chaperone GrpE
MAQQPHESQTNSEAVGQGGLQGPGTSEPPPGQEPLDPTVTAADADVAAAALADLEDRWRRALADLDNLRKRYARELVRERAAERARVAAEFLPVVDNLDRALAHAGDDPSAVLEGVRAVRDQALAALARMGYPRYEEVGVPFDPERHEAVKVVQDVEAVPGTVVEVLHPGYGQGERWLRPAGVAVAAAQG